MVAITFQGQYQGHSKIITDSASLVKVWMTKQFDMTTIVHLLTEVVEPLLCITDAIQFNKVAIRFQGQYKGHPRKEILAPACLAEVWVVNTTGHLQNLIVEPLYKNLVL